MREFSEMIEEYLNELDELENGAAAESPRLPATAAADLEADVAAVLKAAGPGRIKRPCRQRRTGWMSAARRKRAQA